RLTEVNAEGLGEREVRVGVHEMHGQPGKARRDHEDSERLAALAQPEVATSPDAEIIVDPAHDAEPDDQRDQRPSGGRERDGLAADVREQIADDGREDDRETAHRRGAGLGDVRMLDRPVVAYLLADSLQPKLSDEQRSEED